MRFCTHDVRTSCSGPIGPPPQATTPNNPSTMPPMARVNNIESWLGSRLRVGCREKTPWSYGLLCSHGAAVRAPLTPSRHAGRRHVSPYWHSRIITVASDPIARRAVRPSSCLPQTWVVVPPCCIPSRNSRMVNLLFWNIKTSMTVA